jgi:hypothetical protein
MNAFTKLLSLIGSTARSHRRPLLAILLTAAITLPVPALAQHTGGARGGAAPGGSTHGYGGSGYGGHSYYGYGHGYYGHAYYGHPYYGHPYYGYGYYGGCCAAWYPWAYGAYYYPYLPYYYQTYWWNGAPYYYADHTYYQWNAAANGYGVVPPPGGGTEATAGAGGAAAASTDLFAYPTKGQTAEQQSQDRYECHRWAADQTGFDVTQSNGSVAAQDAMAKRGEYVRAQTACLAGRGYSVK